MNFPKEYIKQCDCAEVQGHFESKNLLYEDQCIFYSKEYSKVMDIHSDFHSGFNLKNDGGYIWLPYQHQIFDMIYHYACDLKLSQDFYLWTNWQKKLDSKFIRDKTLTQLWLMFYMWREHEKLWDGEKWINEYSREK